MRSRLRFTSLEERLAPAGLDLHDDVHRVATLPSTTATVTGTAELHLTATTDPLIGSTVSLNSPDAWLFFDNIVPSVVTSTYLSRIKVFDSAAVLNTNVRVVQYGQGAVVIPQSSTFAPLTVFTDPNFAGTATALNQFTAYTSTSLGSNSDAISSFKLKRGYTATFATADNGTGTSRNYVAQDGDLIVPVMPAGLDNTVQFIRVFPWRWTTKKGIAGNIGSQLDIQWKYNWNISENSTADREYVPIRQTRYWPGLGQDWQARGANTLLGYNEPDQASQANLAVGDAVWSWPDLFGTGLRLGAPAVSDGGLSWLYSFISQTEAEGKRVDFVPVHYYRSHNPADPAGAATQFYNFLKGVYDVVKRPLWITEWNNGANWTTDADPTFAQQQACIAAMQDMLETTPFVERYALYNWVEDVRRVEWDDGSLTLAGQTYRDTQSVLSYRQELPDAGSGAGATFAFDNSALDTSGAGQPALAVGTRTYVPGMTGQALEFDGTNDYVQVSPRLGDSTDFTFASWVKWDGGAAWQRIMDLGWDTNKYLFLSPKAGSTGPLRFAIKNGGTEQQLNAAAALTPGVWTHVAVTISGSTGKLFVNGVVVATNPSMSINPVDVGTFYNYLGKSRFSADPLFAGALDDVRFVGSALSDAQIAALAASAATPAVPAPAIALQAGSLRNGGFEENLSTIGWTRTGSAAQSTTNLRSGAAGLRMNGVTGAAEQTVTGLLPNTSYTLTAWARLSNTLAEARLGVKNHGFADAFTATTNTDFTKLSLTFTTGPAATSATVYLSKPTNNYNADFDDVSLVASDALPGSFVNPGFENSPAGSGWTLSGTAAVGTAGVRSGTSAVRMNGGTGKAQQTVTGLLPATTYALTAWGRGSTAATAARVGVQNFGGTDTFTDILNTGYSRGTVVFTTGPAATSATIYVSKPSGSNAADFDDIALVPMTRFTNSNTAATPPVQFFLDTTTLWTVTATSSNQALVTDAKLVLADAGFRKTLAITPEANQTGTVAITLTATDTFGGTASLTFPFLVNAKPAAQAQSIVVPMTQATNITLAGSDPENQALTYSVTAAPSHGTLSGTAPNLTYTPAAGWFGADAFQFTVSDGMAVSTAATVALTVVAPPTTVSLVTVNAGGAQRSRVTSLTVDFALPLNAAQLNVANAITLTRTSGGPPVTLSNGNGISVAPLTGTVSSLTLTFTGSSGLDNGSLADGRWTLSIPYLQYSGPVQRLFGDADANGTINTADLTAFGNAFNTTDPAFDADANGVVDINDLTAFGNRFNVTI